MPQGPIHNFYSSNSLRYTKMCPYPPWAKLQVNVPTTDVAIPYRVNLIQLTQRKFVTSTVNKLNRLAVDREALLLHYIL